jgi:hypothetical protein
VTQVMALLRLAPETREHILALPAATATRRSPISERMFRPITTTTNHSNHVRSFQ